MRKKYVIIVLIWIAFANRPANFFWNAWNKIVLNNVDHFLSCDDLPTADEVSEAFDTHSQFIAQIEAINPQHIFVSMGSSPFHYVTEEFNCPNKSDMMINYTTVADK